MQILHPAVRGLAAAFVAVLTLLLVASPAPAATRTASATVIAPPTGASIPLLTRTGVLTATLNGAKPIHWGGSRLALAKLRPGDRLTLRLHGTKVASASLAGSGTGDAFSRVDAQLAKLAATSQKTVELAQPIAEAQSESAPRAAVAALRAQLTTVESDFVAVGDDLDVSLTRLRAVRPADPARRAAVDAAQAPYVTRLTGVRDSARAAADQATVAAGSLGGASNVPAPPNDGTQTPVDGETEPLPVGTVSEVSSLLERLGDVFASLGLPRPLG